MQTELEEMQRVRSVSNKSEVERSALRSSRLHGMQYSCGRL